MHAMSAMQVGVTAMGAGIVGWGAAVGAHSAANAVEKKSDAGVSTFTTLGVGVGVPLVGVATLLNVPAAAKGGPMPAAILGAVGLGTIAGTLVAAFD